MAAERETMPLDAPSIAEDTVPERGTPESFRQLTLRLRRGGPPPAAVAEEEEIPPAPAASQPVDPGEAAATLLDIIWGAVDLPPQERSMAGDTLLLLLPRLGPRELAMLAERLAAMDQPPPVLVSRLLRDGRPEIGGVLLERSAHLEEADLFSACREGDVERLRLIARRRSVPAAVSEFIAQSGDVLSLLLLLRNPGAQISFRAFLRISAMAGEHTGLQAPLAMRSDLPLAVALDLVWRLPPELRRIIIARFLSDSVTLSRILSIGLTAGETPLLLEGAAPLDEVDAAFGPLLAGRRELSIRRMARLAGLAEATVERIFADGDGEALAVLLKGLGLGRAQFDVMLGRLSGPGGLVRPERLPAEIKAVFDSLSFTKARVLLVYWDWFTRRTGPYAEVAEPGLVEAAALA